MKTQRDELYLILAVVYAAVVVLSAGFVLLFFADEGFLSYGYLITLGILSLVIGYLLAKAALEPLYKKLRGLDFLLKDTLHELNIPLSSIALNAALLKRKGVDGVELERIEASIGRLKQHFAILEEEIRGELGIARAESFMLDEAVACALERSETGSMTISSDPGRLELIANREGFIKTLANLIENAARHAGGGNMLAIYSEEALLVLQDRGEGMDEKTVVRVFDAYYRDESGPGMGLGLSLVKRYCDEHGIRIYIDSKKGEGTKVSLDLSNICEKMV